MDEFSGNGLFPRISAPELYPVSIGGVIVRQSKGDDYLMNGVVFLNAGIGVSAIKTSAERRVRPSVVEIAWFSFAEKRAFYAECRLDEKYIAGLINDGYRLVNGSKGYYSYFDIALFPGGRIAIYLSGDERMKLVEQYSANDTDLPVSVFAPDSGFNNYEEFAEAFIRGDECNDYNDDGVGYRDACEGDGDRTVGHADDIKAAWAENLVENGVDYSMIELFFKKYNYGVTIEFMMANGHLSAKRLDETVLSVEFANGEFFKRAGKGIPQDNYSIIRSVSFEYELDDRSVLCDIYFDMKELAEALSPTNNNNAQNNTLHLTFDYTQLSVTAQFTGESGNCNIEGLRYRIAEYKDGRTMFKGGNS